MNEPILNALHQRRKAISQAIAAIEELSAVKRNPTAKGTYKRSAAFRRRQSTAMRAVWKRRKAEARGEGR